MSRFLKSFRFAANGLKEASKSELNFKVHLFVSILVVLAGWFFEVSLSEWLALVICMGAVLAAELFNTAVEVLVNLISPGFNTKAGLIKDITAAAVLVVALMSLVVGLIIFVPKIF